MGKGQVAPLGEHDVEVEVRGERLVQPDRTVVEPHAFGGQVIGPDYGGVPAGTAPAHVALVEHCHLANPVIGGEIVGRGETVDSGADDDDVVGPLEVVLAPDTLPFMLGQSVANEPESRVSLCGRSVPVAGTLFQGGEA